MKLSQIKSFVENYTELDLDYKTRQRCFVYARAVYFYLAKKHTRNSLKTLADSLQVHHTSVIHSLNNVMPVIFKHDKHLTTLCKNFSQEYKHFVNNTKKGKQHLLDENINLKLEIVKYKTMIKDMNEKQSVQQGC